MSATKKVLKAMGLFSGVQSMGILCSLVRSKLISIWIGPAGVGLFALFNTALDMLSSATQLNLRQSAVRDISRAQASRLPLLAATVRWWSKRLGIAGSLLIVALSPLLSLVSFGDCGYWWGFAALSAAMLALAFTSGEQAIMQGAAQLRPLARSSLAAAVTATALSAPMYYWLGQASIIPSILLFAVAGAAFSRVYRQTPAIPASRSEVVAEGKGFIRLGAYLTISSLAAYASSYVLLSYLNQSASEAEAGCYQAGYTIVMRYVGVIFTALGMEYYPRLAAAASRPRQTGRIVSHQMSLIMCLLAPVAAIFVSVDRWILQILYSSEFLPALPIMTLGIGATAFRAISYCIGYVILAKGDGRTYVVTEVASASIGLALNFCFYRLWGLAGLGASYVAWYALYALMVAAVYRLRYRLRLSRRSMAIAAASIILIGASIALKVVAWWLPLAMLIPGAALMLAARRPIAAKP